MTHRDGGTRTTGRNVAVVGVLVLAAGVTVGLRLWDGESTTDTTPVASPVATTEPDLTPELTTTTEPVATTTTTTEAVVEERPRDVVPPWTVGRPWGSTQGLTMFRGNPTRTFPGGGPAPDDPSVLWSYPGSGMCSEASDLGGTRLWCGFGWTGQPIVWERDDGTTEVIFGAYDRAIHFVDAGTGEALRRKFQTGGHVKGSETLDPDGYPLLYTGSRDGRLRILALDRSPVEELWSIHANEVDGIWNSDWDANPVIIDDIMYQGGENGWFYAYELNRGYDAQRLVAVEPRSLIRMPGYDQDLIARSGRNLSIESSPVAYEQRVYFANSGGRIVGLDVSGIREGEAPVVFDYWAGGDIDATMVVDAEGMLYVSVNVKPDQVAAGYRTAANIARTREVGQLLKLDPFRQGDPLVWGIDLTAGEAQSGSWATPALYEGVVYINTHQGSLIAVDTGNGDILWSDEVGWHSWSSPVVTTDGRLVTATCLGDVRAYDLTDPGAPERLWSLSLGESCLEATPAVWDGRIYIGSRDGFLYALGD